MFLGNSVVGMGNISISFSKRSQKDKQESQEFSEMVVSKDGKKQGHFQNKAEQNRQEINGIRQQS